MSKVIDLLVTFSSAKKEYVSAIEMQDFISGVLFKHYGENIRLGGIEKMRWPSLLKKDEEAFLRIVDRGQRVLKGVPLHFFSVRMIGRQSKRDVMYGTFVVVEL